MLVAAFDDDATVSLCMMGSREDGVKELLRMELGDRESTESWSGALINAPV